jgi:hypothetical protein
MNVSAKMPDADLPFPLHSFQAIPNQFVQIEVAL